MMFCSAVALFFAAQVNKLVCITAVFKEPQKVVRLNYERGGVDVGMERQSFMREEVQVYKEVNVVCGIVYETEG